MRRLGKILSQRLFPGAEHEGLRVLFAQRWAQNDVASYRAAMSAIVGWSVVKQIETIECQTLVVASEEDYTPLSEKEAYVERMQHADLVVIDNARHAVPLEKPEQFNKVLETFLIEQTKHD